MRKVSWCFALVLAILPGTGGKFGGVRSDFGSGGFGGTSLESPAVPEPEPGTASMLLAVWISCGIVAYKRKFRKRSLAQ